MQFFVAVCCFDVDVVKTISDKFVLFYLAAISCIFLIGAINIQVAT
uniref:Uncharacterized protein n=1 Tax=Vibrio crassostreae TaxID=246167 RepID=A0A0H3ZXA2_9VIBR|nr:hypothetical protein [Vibrio crassostreae]AKN40930.1 hypothetical protein [Vibrio crassostreae]